MILHEGSGVVVVGTRVDDVHHAGLTVLSLSTVDGNWVRAGNVDGEAGLLAVGALVGGDEARVELERAAGRASTVEVAKGNGMIVRHVGESDGITHCGRGRLRGERQSVILTNGNLVVGCVCERCESNDGDFGEHLDVLVAWCFKETLLIN